MRCSVARGPRFFKWKVLRESEPYALLLLQLFIALETPDESSSMIIIIIILI